MVHNLWIISYRPLLMEHKSKNVLYKKLNLSVSTYVSVWVSLGYLFQPNTIYYYIIRWIAFYYCILKFITEYYLLLINWRVWYSILQPIIVDWSTLQCYLLLQSKNVQTGSSIFRRWNKITNNMINPEHHSLMNTFMINSPILSL